MGSKSQKEAFDVVQRIREHGGIEILGKNRANELQYGALLDAVSSEFAFC